MHVCYVLPYYTVLCYIMHCVADLKHSAKGVKSATADVVASSNFGQQMIDDAGEPSTA